MNGCWLLAPFLKNIVLNGSGIAFVGKQSRIVKWFDNRGNTLLTESYFGTAVKYIKTKI